MAWQKRNMFSSAVDMQRGGAVPWPNYQMGGPIMPTQLFEEGDQDINMALNNMAGITNPSIEQIKETEMPLVGDEMTMDQGPASFEDALGELKQSFYDEIISYVSQLQDMGEMEKYLKGIGVAYSNELRKLKKTFNVEEIHPDEELLTPNFIVELQNMLTAPEMQLGGLIKSEADLIEYNVPVSWKAWQLLTDEQKERWVQSSLAASAGSSGTATSPLDVVYREGTKGQPPVTVGQRLNQIIEDRKKLARQSAEMPLTKQGGFGGFAEQMNAYRANQAAAQDKVLADELDMLQYGQNRYGTKSGTEWTADLRNRIFDEPDPVMSPKDWLDSAEAAARADQVDPVEILPWTMVYLAVMGKQEVIEALQGEGSVFGRVKKVDTDVNGVKVPQNMTFSDYVLHLQKTDDTFTLDKARQYIATFNSLDAGD